MAVTKLFQVSLPTRENEATLKKPKQIVKRQLAGLLVTLVEAPPRDSSCRPAVTLQIHCTSQLRQALQKKQTSCWPPQPSAASVNHEWPRASGRGLRARSV